MLLYLAVLRCGGVYLPLNTAYKGGEVAYFLEATRAVVEGPYDLSLVEGSVTTADDAERIQQVRAASRRLVTIGACATAGGIQALRNFADVDEFRAAVYARPEYVETLGTSTPIAAHVPVDFELRGCPIDKNQLLEVLAAELQRRTPRISSHSVCVECKRRGTAFRRSPSTRAQVEPAFWARPRSCSLTPLLLRAIRHDGDISFSRA